MPVDHSHRQRHSLNEALRLFAEHGYGAITFQQIADRCGIARTTIYRYFAAKRDLLDAAVRQFVHSIGDRIEPLAEQTALPATQRIETTMNVVLTAVFEEHVLLTEMLDYLLERKKEDVDISRHTVGMKRLLQKLLAEAVRRREVAVGQVATARDLLYGLLETAIMEATVSGTADRRHLADMVHLAVSSLRTA